MVSWLTWFLGAEHTANDFFLTISECIVTCPPYLKNMNPTEKIPGEMAVAQPGAEKLFSMDFQSLTVIFSLIVNSQSSFRRGRGSGYSNTAISIAIGGSLCFSCPIHPMAHNWAVSLGSHLLPMPAQEPTMTPQRNPQDPQSGLQGPPQRPVISQVPTVPPHFLLLPSTATR